MCVEGPNVLSAEDRVRPAGYFQVVEGGVVLGKVEGVFR